MTIAIASPRLPLVRDPRPPGRVRKTVEKVGGTLGSMSKIPFAILPCLVGGAILSGRPSTSEKRVATALDITNATQASVSLGLALSAGGGFSGFMRALLTKGLVGGVTVAMVSRGGSSVQLTRHLVAELPHSDGGWKAAGKGAMLGAKIGLVAGAKVGWSEGRGYVCGIYDGIAGVRQLIAEEAKSGLARPGGHLARSVALGTVMAPVGLVAGFVDAMAGAPIWNTRLQAGASAAFAGAGGLLAGWYLGGDTLGAGIGALVGASLGLAAHAASGGQRQVAFVQDAVLRVAESNPKMDDSVAARNRDFFCGAVVGASAGFRGLRRG